MDVLFFASITKMKQPKGGSGHQVDKIKSSYPLRSAASPNEASQKKGIARLGVSAAQRNGLNEVSSEHKHGLWFCFLTFENQSIKKQKGTAVARNTGRASGIKNQADRRELVAALFYYGAQNRTSTTDTPYNCLWLP